ncbi:MAG: polysaccharide deacetylase family protein [Verrucomicrobiota bacterium]
MKRESQYTLAAPAVATLQRCGRVAAGVLLLAFVVALGLTMQRLRESHRTRAVPILMYHKIGAVTNNAWWVPTGVFERQLRALRNQGYSTILPDDIVNHRKAGKRLPPKPVMITFDDGYRNSLALAEPLLKKYGFRAVVYLITDTVAETPETRRQYEGVDVLTWPEIKAMQKRGTFVFGGHGHRHQNLAALTDPYPDIRECYLRLRRQGIRQPFSFCYPYGQYNARTIAAVKHAGFRSAMVCEDRVALTGKPMNLLALPRVSVMGGEHEFHVKPSRYPPEGGVIGIMHTGIPMEVSPRLIWSGLPARPSYAHRSKGFATFLRPPEQASRRREAGAAPAKAGATVEQGWLPAVEVRNADYEWRWPANGSNAAPVRLEIWDKHRLFLMWSGKIFDSRTKTD